MNSRYPSAGGGILEDLTLPELVDIWVEREIDKRLNEVDFFHTDIINGALGMRRLQVMPLRGGVHESPRSIEVLVEVRDQFQRLSRIGAWQERKRSTDDLDAFKRAYDKAMAHAIIQLLPASTWRPWLRSASNAV